MVLLAALFFTLWLALPASPVQEELPPLYVHVFGIGRADAILIHTQDHAVMIDTGENRHGEYLVSQLTALGISRLDYLIITHFDSDHVGGAHTIIDALEIGEIIIPNYSRESRHTDRFYAAMARAQISPYILEETRRFTLDGAYFIVDPSPLPYFHFPRHADDYFYEALDAWMDMPTGDDFSIVVAVSHGAQNLLFTGDAMPFRIGVLLGNAELMSPDYSFLKVPRHGRFTYHGVELIHRTRPRYAVITGFHPSDAEIFYSQRPADERIIAALDEVGAYVFFTMTQGISFRSDGVTLQHLRESQHNE